VVTLTGEVTMARSGGFETRITDVTDRYTSANSGLAASNSGLGASEPLADDGSGDFTMFTDGGGDDIVFTDDEGSDDDTMLAGDDVEASTPTPVTVEAPLI
jgi:hypothetical protein